VFGGAQLFVALNTTLAAMLQAVREVRDWARDIAAKFLWGAGIVAASSSTRRCGAGGRFLFVGDGEVDPAVPARQKHLGLRVRMTSRPAARRGASSLLL